MVIRRIRHEAGNFMRKSFTGTGGSPSRKRPVHSTWICMAYPCSGLNTVTQFGRYQVKCSLPSIDAASHDAMMANRFIVQLRFDCVYFKGL